MKSQHSISILISTLLFGACTHKPLPKIQWQKIDEQVLPKVQEATLKDRHAEASYLAFLAEMFLLEGKVKQARLAFSDAFSLDPHPELAAKVLTLQSLTLTPEKFLVEAKKQTLLYPNSAWMHYLYAKACMVNKKWPAAEDAILQALKLSQNHPAIYMDAVSLFLEREKKDLAFSFSQQLIENHPYFARGYFTLATLFKDRDDEAAAAENFRRAYALEPKNALYFSAAVLAANPVRTDLINLLDSMFNDYFVESTLQVFLNIFPDLDFSEVPKWPDHEKEYALFSGLFFLAKGRADQAIEVLDRASQPTAWEPLTYTKALIYQTQSEFDNALAHFAEVSKESSLYLSALLKKMEIYRQQGKGEEGLKIAKRIVKLVDQLTPEQGIFIAKYLSEWQSEKEAIPILEKVQQTKQVLFTKAFLKESLGRRAEAVEDMIRVIEMDADHAESLNFVAYIYALEKKYLRTARRLALRALSLKPNHPYFLDTLGWIYFQAGKVEKAKELIEQAYQIEPKEPEILQHLAEIYRKLGDLENETRIRQELSEVENT